MQNITFFSKSANNHRGGGGGAAHLPLRHTHTPPQIFQNALCVVR